MCSPNLDSLMYSVSLDFLDCCFVFVFSLLNASFLVNPPVESALWGFHFKPWLLKIAGMLELSHAASQLENSFWTHLFGADSSEAEIRTLKLCFPFLNWPLWRFLFLSQAI